MVHEHADRLIYAVDLDFLDCEKPAAAQIKAMRCLDEVTRSLAGLGIIIKGNNLFRFFGWTALAHFQMNGFDIFADYKLFDNRNTIDNDASWLRFFENIKILTVAERVHPEVFINLARTLPKVTIALVNPLTDLEDHHFDGWGEVDREHAVRQYFDRVAQLPVRGAICSAHDLQYASKGLLEGREMITAANRPAFAVVENDRNVANSRTPRESILAGASRLIVGGPMRHNGDMQGNALRILDEIGEALREKNGG